MNTKPTYSEKLLDPRWQKKRLEIFNRDKWTCQLCGDTETTFNVHHLSYKPKTEPWDYEDSNFQTLCCWCHSVVEMAKKRGATVLICAKWSYPGNDVPFFIAAVQLQEGKRFVELYRYDPVENCLFHMIGISPESMSRFNNLLSLSEKLQEPK